MLRHLVLLAVGVLAFVGPRTAFAQGAEVGERTRPAMFSLSVAEADPLASCGGAPALRQEVEQRLRRPVWTEEGPADIALEVEVEPSAGATEPGAERVAHIVQRDRDGTELGRRDVPIPGDDCAKALETLAVVLAIMIGPPRTIVEAAPPPAPPPPPPRPRPRPRRRRTHPVAPRPAGRWTLGALVEGAAGTGVLPGLAFGLSAGAMVQPPRSRLSVIGRAQLWPSRSTGGPPTAEVSRLSGSLLVCYDLIRDAPLLLLGCGGADAGQVRARSVELTRGSETAPLLDVFAEGRLGYRSQGRGPLAVEPFLAAQVAALLRRDRFTYRDESGRELVLLQPAPVAFQLAVGVAVHFL